ncbi:MAG: hypothetical protein ACI358_06645 [Candidatus Limimorpha sp.]
MKLKIEAVYGKNRSRKSVTFDITDEVADFFIKEIMSKHDGTSTAQVEGGANMKINISVLHTEQSY